MFSRLVALFVLAIWLGLIGLGYAANDDLDTYLVPSLVALDNQDYGDDVDSYRLFDLAIAPFVFFLNLPATTLDQGFTHLSKTLKDDKKLFKVNRSFLL